jgi:hypothetical protein
MVVNTQVRHVLTLLLATLFWLPMAGTASTDEFSATVDRSRVAANESFTLKLTWQGQAMSAPDFSPLEKDFDILSRQQQSQLSLGFGSGNQSTTEWVLSLMPKRAGKLTIPALDFKGVQSNPLSIEVTQAKAASDSSQAIFVETEVDKDSVVVQSQIIMTLRLNTSVRISSLDIGNLELPNAKVVKIDESQYQKLINGRDHIVVEVKYAIFPEQAGPLTIPALRIDGVVPDRRDPFGGLGGSTFFGGGRTFHLKSEAKTIQVDPMPAEAQGHSWFPAKGVSVSERWSDRSKSIAVGEPITRSITITAQGLTGAQIPPLDMASSDRVRLYPDQPEISETLSSSGVLGTRTESVAIVPTEPGQITLPATTLTWWDTASNSLKETRLDAVTLDVSPAVSPAQSQPLATSPEANSAESAEDETTAESGPLAGNRLLTASLVINLILLIMLFALAASGRKRRIRTHVTQTPTAPSPEKLEKAAFEKLRQGATAEPAQFRQRLLQWAALFWREDSPSTLNEIAHLAGSPELKNLFANLDNSLYGKATESVDTGAILNALEAVRKAGPRAHQPGGKMSSTLRPLYP